ncbi:hypothetical protein D9615_006180 [Tricholomella constricta]|uniref:Aldehyde dehydrogenase domain-containing protein n=1 Tax=Tricholomella constricta TaxID=117010 RepID=A0A8H5M448_9AGAR|nr:hypothetical protein D9615_006180 [Tricholomella constricta]
MLPLTPLYIDGQWTRASTGSTFDVSNPASGQTVGHSASASSADCRAAISSAARAFEAWERTSHAERRAVFLRAADLVEGEKYREKIRETMQAETAAVEYWCTYNWASAANVLRTAAGFLNEMGGETLPSAVPGAKVETHRRAMGVILSIAPWNAPFTLSLRAIAIPIICGNTVVLKSSEYSPRSQAAVVELFHEAGLPKGVLNYVSMAREDAPALTAELIAHPMVRKINFTGSDRVGRIIAIEAAKYLKPCVLELGGKAPVVVLDDADVGEAAKAIVYGAMAHSGQICMSSERVIVQSGVAPRLVPAVRELCTKLGAGAELSALFTPGSAENVVGVVREAVDAGAELLLGDMTAEGAVVKPHLVKGVKPGMRIWDRESFGPVVGFAVVDTVEEAIGLANASEYSLTASVWTSNVYLAQTVASAIRAGFVNINGATVHSEPLAGLRGLGGASGYGRFDVDSFTDVRVVVTHPAGRKYPLV